MIWLYRSLAPSVEEGGTGRVQMTSTCLRGAWGMGGGQRPVIFVTRTKSFVSYLLYSSTVYCNFTDTKKKINNIHLYSNRLPHTLSYVVKRMTIKNAGLHEPETQIFFMHRRI